MKLMRTVQKVLFYLSSFIPLYILLVVQNIKVLDENKELLSFDLFWKQFFQPNSTVTIFWTGLLVFSLISLFGVVIFFQVYVKTDGRSGKIKNVELVREDTMGYIVTYIVPLISMDVNSVRSLTVNLILFIIIGTFYVKNDQLFMNPLYNVCGYNVFSADDEIYITKINKTQLKIIAKRQQSVEKVNLIGDIYVIKESQNKPQNTGDLYR